MTEVYIYYEVFGLSRPASKLAEFATLDQALSYVYRYNLRHWAIYEVSA